MMKIYLWSWLFFKLTCKDLWAFSQLWKPRKQLNSISLSQCCPQSWLCLRFPRKASEVALQIYHIEMSVSLTKLNTPKPARTDCLKRPWLSMNEDFYDRTIRKVIFYSHCDMGRGCIAAYIPSKPIFLWTSLICDLLTFMSSLLWVPGKEKRTHAPCLQLLSPEMHKILVIPLNT